LNCYDQSIKYYRYNAALDQTAPPASWWPYGDIWIYRIELCPQATDPSKKYYLSIFNRITRKWMALGFIGQMPDDYKPINQKELFLELL